MPGTKIWTRCLVCPEHRLDGNREICSEEMKIDENIYFKNCTRKYSELSTSSTMSQNSTPIFVYQRRKQRKNSVAVSNVQPCDGTKPSDACPSAICSEAPSLSPQEHPISVSECATEGVRSPFMHPVECNEVSEEPLRIDVNRTMNACNGNENCSSSKSNLELSTAALKNDRIEAGECSSSGALIAVPSEISERGISTLILRTQGLLDAFSTRQNGVSGVSTKKSSGVSRKKNCSKSCKACKHMDITSNMLICDNCENVFHISCYSPRIAMLPVNEWLCSSCLKKKHKILKDKSTSNVVNTEIGRNQDLASELDMGSLELMFKDTEPYMSNVRIGNAFQADIPDCRGPVNKACDLTGDPLETDSYYNIDVQQKDYISVKPLQLSFIGNWLQCREAIGEGEHERICGKWRRAPLNEVQTDKWECFCCIRWDPLHADCSVPQELDTEEVMKQLKYVEMIRPRAKRRKLNSSKSSGSKDVS